MHIARLPARRFVAAAPKSHFFSQRVTHNAIALLAQNNFQAVPTPLATREVRETFVLARGVMPASHPLTPLLCNTRAFSSFNGTPRDFIKDIQAGHVLVFFYKPACEPCKAIRRRLINTVGEGITFVKRHVHDGAAGSSPSHKAPAGEEVQFVSHKDADVALTEGEEEPLAALPLDSAPLMSVEDQKTCEELRALLQQQASERAGHGKGPHEVPLRIVTVNTDVNRRITALHDVRSLPTFVGYNDGRVVGRVEGAGQEELLNLLKKLFKPSATAEEGAANEDF